MKVMPAVDVLLDIENHLGGCKRKIMIDFKCISCPYWTAYAFKVYHDADW
jgi:hypothetical protein